MSTPKKASPSSKTTSADTTSTDKGTNAAGDPNTAEVKDRFKQALEKKRNASHGTSSQTASGGRAIGPGSANNKTQQMFRRKSGGS